MEKLFFHGEILIDVVEAKDLPNVEVTWYRVRKAKRNNVSDPYVAFDMIADGESTCRIAKTRVIMDNLNPKWRENFRMPVCHEFDSIFIEIKDKNLMEDKKMCSLAINALELYERKQIGPKWSPLQNDNGKSMGEIYFSIKFVPIYTVIWKYEVPGVMFPVHSNCYVKLYQDAHTPATSPITDVITRDGIAYNPPQCWEDISEKMNKAEKLIYIIGWSVYTEISLLRRNKNEETLGALLKRKANEGVRVLMMVWDEPANDFDFFAGMMGTHDEETFQYFQGTEVHCLKAPRTAPHSGLISTSFASANYTHHQKCVLLDSQNKLVAFQGGIDLTNGRWDTHDHSLYKSLYHEHKKDFYNNVITTTQIQGPRQPWEDIHMYVEGSVVKDLMNNFENRWRLLAPQKAILLYPHKNLEFDCSPSEDESWNVQFFRSINSDSVTFPTESFHILKSRVGRKYDDSIQQAYIHHIRRAQKFIYIENQYFMGSSSGWKHRITKCTNLIPAELTARIILAIKNHQDFRVYINIPLHPEGVPTSGAVQELLRWQFRTIEMMYKKIGKVIRETGIHAHPTDYLSFFCLTKRESEAPTNLPLPPENTIAYKVRQSLRFMIYIHSKLAIFDDEYIIVGTANINERSMNGNRDSEMALGSYQPNLIPQDPGDFCKGDIHTFRLSLWAEHCGQHMRQHLNPSSIECMKAMINVGQTNLHRYVHAIGEDSHSHLMSYPYQIENDGKVFPRSDFKEFPDTGGSVCGESKNLFPVLLTT